MMGGAMLASFLWGRALAASEQRPVVRIAELEIEPDQLANYKAAVKEEMETAVRIEPGVLAIYSVAEKAHPTRLWFFEIYADEHAYEAHVKSPHFIKYVATTKAMIRSRKLTETVPVLLSAKPKQ
jgi:quinol monooxygenase YgiN